MPAPHRLLERIKKVQPCGACKDGDWILDEARGMKRCECLRGRLLRKSDELREGKQVMQQELELQ